MLSGEFHLRKIERYIFFFIDVLLQVLLGNGREHPFPTCRELTQLTRKASGKWIHQTAEEIWHLCYDARTVLFEAFLLFNDWHFSFPFSVKSKKSKSVRLPYISAMPTACGIAGWASDKADSPAPAVSLTKTGYLWIRLAASFWSVPTAFSC